MNISKFLAIGAFAFAFALTGCVSDDPCPAGSECGFVIIDDDTASTDARFSPRPPDNQISKFSFEAAVKLCFRQPNYPMCAFDCIENPDRSPWNDWCEIEPAPADQIINPNEYTEEELLEILED